MRGDAHRRAVAEALEAVGLTDRAGDVVKEYSGGMKRRLNFACGVVHKPKILLLDEPTAGVDPQSRMHLLDQVRAQAAAGTCVLYTTHYMEEAQELCDRLAILDGGHVIAQGTLEELRNMMGEKDLLRLTGKFDPLKAREAAEGIEGVEVVSAEADVLMLASKTATKMLPEVFRAMETAGAEIRETTLSQANLESLFIKLTGKALRE
jgi:ABC-2 type transport system ATP-binding protein